MTLIPFSVICHPYIAISSTQFLRLANRQHESCLTLLKARFFQGLGWWPELFTRCWLWHSLQPSETLSSRCSVWIDKDVVSLNFTRLNRRKFFCASCGNQKFSAERCIAEKLPDLHRAADFCGPDIIVINEKRASLVRERVKQSEIRRLIHAREDFHRIARCIR